MGKKWKIGPDRKWGKMAEEYQTFGKLARSIFAVFFGHFSPFSIRANCQRFSLFFPFLVFGPFSIACKPRAIAIIEFKLRSLQDKSSPLLKLLEIWTQKLEAIHPEIFNNTKHVQTIACRLWKAKKQPSAGSIHHVMRYFSGRVLKCPENLQNLSHHMTS